MKAFRFLGRVGKDLGHVGRERQVRHRTTRPLSIELEDNNSSYGATGCMGPTSPSPTCLARPTCPRSFVLTVRKMRCSASLKGSKCNSPGQRPG